jgi:hypothetical protein
MAVISNGTTLIDNGILDAAVPTGSLILLSTQTASASATISFTSGIDSTYDSYVFKFYDIHPASDSQYFSFQGSTNGGSTYATTVTTTDFSAYHNESDSASGLGYETGADQAQGTAFIKISNTVGNGADESCVGYLNLYNPSSTTFVKHFINRSQTYQATDYSVDEYKAGYFNTTSAINAVQFKFASGNIDSGIIKLYGVAFNNKREFSWL